VSLDLSLRQVSGYNAGQEKFKLYTLDDKVTLKGDATIFYARPESVEVALDNLNGSEIRPGFKISIDRAQFQQHGEQYKERQKRFFDKVAKIKTKANQEK
jgi:hypothetical protein